LLSALALTAALFTAKPGDTLSGVTQHYNTSWEAVYDHNQSAVSDPILISAGHKLHVVDGDRTKTLAHVQAATAHSSSSSDRGRSVPVQSYRVTPAPASTSAQGVSGGASSSGSGYDSSALGDIPGVPQSFAACVAYRESTNDTNPAANGNAYGIIPASGYSVSGDSIAQQKQVFKQIYDTSGPGAWAADGC
jgi:LysM repeat protein